MRSMIMRRRRGPWRSVGPCRAGASSARPERAADADRDVTARDGAASGPSARRAFEPAIADRDDRRAGAQGEDRDAVRASWSAPSGLRVPSGKTNRTWPSSRIRLASRNASTSARSTVDRVDAAVRRGPADDRPGEQLLLAQPVDPPPELAASATSRGRSRRGSRRGWRRGSPAPPRGSRRWRLRARIRLTARAEDPATEGQRRDERRDRVLDRLGRRGGRDRAVMRGCRARRARRRGAPRRRGSR